MNLLHYLFLAALLVLMFGCQNDADSESSSGAGEQSSSAKRGVSNLQKISTAVTAIGFGGQRSLDVSEPGKPFVRTELNFSGIGAFSDQSLKHLEGLKEIVGISLNRTKITDSGLSVLTTLPDLEYLQLADTKITRDGLKTLKNCQNLTRLDIRDTKIGVESKEILESFPQLKLVYCKGTGIEELNGIEVNSDEELGIYWGNRTLPEYLEENRRLGISK
jgi:hypothetical protein